MYNPDMDTLERILDRIQVQDLIATFFSGVVGFLWLTGQEVPEGLLNVTLIIIGFFFGDKNATRAQERAMSTLNPPPAEPLIED
jgi:hypothetical protein